MIHIDLKLMKQGLLSENQAFGSFEGNIKRLIGRMFGKNQDSAKILGDREDLKSFAKVMNAERQYVQAIHDAGSELEAPKVKGARYELDAAIREFELNTGIPFPLQHK